MATISHIAIKSRIMDMQMVLLRHLGGLIENGNNRYISTT
jgi:hypothetical protein